MTLVKGLSLAIAVTFALIAQLMAVLRASRVTGNGEWSPVQLTILVANLIFIAGLVYVLRRERIWLTIGYLFFGSLVVAFVAQALTVWLNEY
jgi:hypothetical protein